MRRTAARAVRKCPVAPCLRDHLADMLLDPAFIERVDGCRVHHPSGSGDLLCHRIELCWCTTGQEDPGALAREGTRDRAAHQPAPSIDNGNLLLEQHRNLLSQSPSS
jgi:hypothetical protein